MANGVIITGNAVQARNKAIETLREGGLTYEEIGKTVGLSIGRVGSILHDEEFKEHRKKYRQGEKYQLWNRDYRRQNMLTVNGKTIIVRKRQRPNDICETCGEIVGRLFYHHWNDDEPHLGVWVCYRCHKVVEAVDRDDFDNIRSRYMELKTLVLSGEGYEQ